MSQVLLELLGLVVLYLLLDLVERMCLALLLHSLLQESLLVYLLILQEAEDLVLVVIRDITHLRPRGGDLGLHYLRQMRYL